MVKEGRRKRYIGFVVTASKHDVMFSRSDMIETLNMFTAQMKHNNERGDHPVKLIIFEENTGIIRCPHHMKERVIELLESIKTIKSNAVSLSTTATSGTIRSLKSIYPKNKQLRKTESDT